MRMKKVGVILLLLLFLTGCTAKNVPEKGEEQLTMKYYYYPTCEGCTDGEGFQAYIEEMLSDVLDADDYKFELKNVAEEEAYNEFQKIVEEYQTEEFYPTAPVMVVGDTYLFGLEEIERQIRQAAIEGYNAVTREEQFWEKMEDIPEEDSYFVYFYKEECKYCRGAESFIADLEKEQTLNDGTLSKLHFTYIDISKMENMPIAREFYKKYNVPKEEWKAPMIFWKGGYLMGEKKIKEQILGIVREGQAVGWPGTEAVPVENQGKSPR